MKQTVGNAQISPGSSAADLLSHHAAVRPVHEQEIPRSAGDEDCARGRDFSRVPVARIQGKSITGRPEDRFELEAERVADQVTAASKYSAAGGALPHIHRFIAESNGQTGVETPNSVDKALALSGDPLEASLRQDMERCFDHDFARVRVHSGDVAGQSARDVNARAYTVGKNIVFGAGQYAPGTHEGRRLIAHELTHVVQQSGTCRVQVGHDDDPRRLLPIPPSKLIQREPDKSSPKKDPAKKPRVEKPSKQQPDKKTLKSEGVALSKILMELADKNVKTYVTYKDAISKSTPKEKQAALNTALLSKLKDTLDFLSFARCVESLGRKAPTFDELRKNSVVAEAIKDAWKASDVGTRDLVTQPHEEGGWVFMNLIDGSLSIERAKAEGTDFIRVEPPPDVENSVLVAIFHTHPHLGSTAKPSRDDKREDERRGVPNLVAGNTGTKSDVFDIFLSGPAVRKHLASDTKIPGKSGGIAP